jgi:riboflavin kinase/FMN adenylyltransferase
MQLKACGIDRVLRVRFNHALSQVPAEEFIRNIFVDGLGVKYFVVGDDLRFGHDRRGDFNLLRKEGKDHGFEVVDTNTLQIEGERASSTRVRQALEQADFALAEELLGRPYAITGKVVVGQQLGRQLGFPTANIQLRRFRSALTGVYAVEVEGIKDGLIPGVANIGTRPTVNSTIKAILEVHLLDFDGDIYGKTISVIFRKKMRDEKKFDSLDELKANIQADADQTRVYFNLPAR